MRSIAASAASKPPSRKTAPNTASSASARIDGRAAPPLFSSPSPSRMALPRSSAARQPAQRVLVDQVGAQARQLALREAAGKRRYSASAIAQLSTLSPRNSSRSLWSAPKLRCVSAWRSSSGRRKRGRALRSAAGRHQPRGITWSPVASKSSSSADVADQRQLVASRSPVATSRVAFLDHVEVRAAHRLDVVGARLRRSRCGISPA